MTNQNSKLKVVLAYSGGLDTTFCVSYLQENYNADVIAVTFDLGQKDDFNDVRERALKIGAIDHILVDAKKTFADEFLAKTIKTNALYEKAYPLHSSLQGYYIARGLCEIAYQKGADAVAHGNTGLGNDQFRYDISFGIFGPDLKIIAPVREGNFTRIQEWKYLNERGIKVNRPDDNLYSVADNLWGFFRGDFSDAGNPEVETDPVIFSIVNRQNPTNNSEKIWIEFEKGIPNGIDNRKMDLDQILIHLNEKLGKYGFGMIDYVESSVYSTKIRQTVEGPAAFALIKAHEDIERLVLTKRQLSVKPYLEQRWTEFIFEGLYYDPACRDIESFIDSTQKLCTGKVLLEIHPYSVECIARKSKFTLYKPELYDYENAEIEHAKGAAFAELWGRGTVAANILRKND